MRRFVLLLIIGIMLSIPASPAIAAEQLTPETGRGAAGTYPLSPPDLEAQGGVLIDRDSGALLYAKNAGSRLYPASTTKILTALLVLEHGPLSEQITVGEEVSLIPADASQAGLQAGDRLSLKELLYALMLPSGNDAAYVLAVHIGGEGSEKLTARQAAARFAEQMNQRAAAIGAVDSHFVNPDGYHNPDHYSTPYDMALIACEAMKNPVFREVVATLEHSPRGQFVFEGKIKWENTNKLLQPENAYYMSEANGIKTGRTQQAGYCLVSSASRNNKNLIAVVLRSSEAELYKDSRRFLDFGFIEDPPTGLPAPATEKSSNIPGPALFGAVGLAALLYLGTRVRENVRRRKQTHSR